jgi:predicted membrane-bound dolichyl-phosphate-mannose-protein mannosyltransferase
MVPAKGRILILLTALNMLMAHHHLAVVDVVVGHNNLLVAVFGVRARVLSAHVLGLAGRVATDLEFVLVPVWLLLLVRVRLEADSVLQVVRHIDVIEVLLVDHIAGVCLLEGTGNATVLGSV